MVEVVCIPWCTYCTSMFFLVYPHHFSIVMILQNHQFYTHILSFLSICRINWECQNDLVLVTAIPIFDSHPKLTHKSDYKSGTSDIGDENLEVDFRCTSLVTIYCHQTNFATDLGGVCVFVGGVVRSVLDWNAKFE